MGSSRRRKDILGRRVCFRKRENSSKKQRGFFEEGWRGFLEEKEEVLRRKGGSSRGKRFFEEERVFIEYSFQFSILGCEDRRIDPHVRSSGSKVEEPSIFDLKLRRSKILFAEPMIGSKITWVLWSGKYCARRSPARYFFVNLLYFLETLADALEGDSSSGLVSTS